MDQLIDGGGIAVIHADVYLEVPASRGFSELDRDLFGCRVA